MNSIKIRVHSFIDIITNSSTEIYVCAGNGTVNSIKKLVDSILKAGKSDKRFDDLFEISLGEEEEHEWVGYSTCEVYVNTDLDDEDAKYAAKILSDLTGLFDINAAYDG